MATLQKILCPVDFSSASDLAVEYALALGRRAGSEVALMHVLPKALADPDVYPWLDAAVPTSAETRERAFQLMGAFVHRALAQGTSAEVILEDGDVVEVVVARAKKLGADLVVMGTHGRRGFQRLLLGSVTEKLLRRSEVPVLAVPPSAPAPRKEGSVFRKILCPVDFSPASTAALDLARRMGGEDAEILALHAVELFLQPALVEAVPFDVAGLREQFRRQAEKRLEDLVPEDAGKRIRTEVAAPETSAAPYREILRVAEREKSELIAMGVAGRSAVDHLFFGSTTNHVVRTASVPVLTVRARTE